MVQSRTIHIYRRQQAAAIARCKKTVRSNLEDDLRLLDEAANSLTEDPAVLLRHTVSIAELYRALYLTKHSELNPQYTPRFFELLLSSGLVRSAGWIEEGRLVAFTMLLHIEDAVRSVAVGYDTAVPRQVGLYRRAIAYAIAYADKANCPMNLGAGVEDYKRFRGAVAANEYDAVFDRHLDARRRLAWRVVEWSRSRHRGSLRSASATGAAGAQHAEP
jgi:hypothetical protein